MHVFADLSEYSYRFGAGSRSGVLNVGWIDLLQPYATWNAPPDFLAKLWRYCRTPAVVWRHMLFCAKCSFKAEIPCTETWDDQQLVLGTGEIRVFGKGETVYAAPDMVFHYVKQHHYHPPTDFIEAVNQGEDPSSEFYVAALLRLCLKRNEPLTKADYWPAPPQNSSSTNGGSGKH
jgi:hypothetical protein